MPTIQENLLQLNTTIRALEKKYHRPAHSVSLLAMSKGQPLEKLQQAIAAGQCLFGENYLQEAMKKMERLKQPGLEWHFTGTLQSNKTRPVAEHFSWVHTVTTPRLAQRLNDQRPVHLPSLNICLEVNVSGEASKSGLREEAELMVLAEACLSLPRLKLRGLMTIPKPVTGLAEQRAELHQLFLLKEKLGQRGFALDTLSMGMTDDLEAAIAEGATYIRVGRGIFGPRSPSPREGKGGRL